MKIKAAVFCVLFVLVSSASYGWISFTPSVTDDDLVKVFEEIEANGPSAAAAEALEGYIGKNAYRAPADEAMLALGRVYSKLDEPAKAAAAYGRLLEYFPMSRFKLDALYELGDLRYRNGQLKEAEELIEQVSTSGEAPVSLRVRAKVLLKDIDAALYVDDYKFDVPVIGALLPMKGQYSAFGEAALRGVLLAAEVFEETYGPVEIRVRNVSTDRKEARDAVKELASDDHVVGVVGPLLSYTAGDAAYYAQRKGLPMVNLSLREGITGAGDYVFRNSLTPEQQARAIAEYATYELGLKTFVIMNPENSYGTALASIFESEVTRLGGTVVKKTSYRPGTRDFSEQFTYLFDIQVEERKEGRRSIRVFKPNVEAEAVFIPDYYETVSLIAPYFDYYNIEGVQLLGSNGWDSEGLVETAGKYLEGAVFVDGFFPESARPGTREFTSRFRHTFGKDPGVLEAQAFDAAKMIITALGERGADPSERPGRREIRDRLLGLEGYTGAAGEVGFDYDGEAEKKLFVLTVKKGRITEAPVTKLPPVEPAVESGTGGEGTATDQGPVEPASPPAPADAAQPAGQ